jgi:DNA-directed RNA polymerase specialized sigma24 family protein
MSIADDRCDRNVVEQFLRSAEVLIEKYPDPLVYASVRTSHAGIDFERSERKQRCEGTHLKKNAAGERTRGRTGISGDAPRPAGEGPLFDCLVDVRVDFVETIAAADEAGAILERCLQGLAQADRHLLYSVDGHAMYITELAKKTGQRRETLNRRLTKIRGLARANASDFTAAA